MISIIELMWEIRQLFRGIGYNSRQNGDEQKMALSVCGTVIDDFARELLKHGTAAFPIACHHDDLQTEPVPLALA